MNSNKFTLLRDEQGERFVAHPLQRQESEASAASEVLNWAAEMEQEDDESLFEQPCPRTAVYHPYYQTTTLEERRAARIASWESKGWLLPEKVVPYRVSNARNAPPLCRVGFKF